MGNKGRWEYLRAIYDRYRAAGREVKQVILNEFCANTGYHRKYAIRLLNGAPPKRGKVLARRRGLAYNLETQAVLTAVWEAAGYPWSVRLKALLPQWLPWIRKRFRLRPEIEQQLLRISARQMDRRLKAQKRQRRRSIYGRTKPGYLLKHHIPVKTDRWDVHHPGFTEVDLVSHSGNSASGEFAHTLNVTDIHTTWTESRAVLGRGEEAVQRALNEIAQVLPFALLGVDSDNGSEFINWQLVRGEADSDDAGAAVQEGRQRAHRAEELDARAQAAGLGSLRHARSGSHPQRALRRRTALVAESVSAFGETAEEGARGQQGATGVRRGAHPPRDSHFPTAAPTSFRLHFQCLDNPSYGYILKWLDRTLSLIDLDFDSPLA